MKFFAVLAAAAIAVASAQTPCDPKLVVVATQSENAKKCTADSTYTAASLKVPTGEVLAKACASSNCRALLAEISTVVPTSCVFAGVDIKTDIIDKFGPACASVGGGATPTTAPAATTAAPAATTAAPAATTTAPAATTAAPAATTAAPEATTAAPEVTTAAPAGSAGADPIESPSAGSEAGSESSGEDDADVTTAPGTTAVPTPTPASSAATVTFAAGAVVATAVASLL